MIDRFAPVFHWKQWALVLSCAALMTAGCESGVLKSRKKSFMERDTTITVQNAYNERFMDSAQVERYLASAHLDTATADNMRSFYNSRNYQYAWLEPQGLNEQAISFWNLLGSYMHMSKDSSLYNKELAATMQDYIDDAPHDLSDDAAHTDLALTALFFRYAHTAYVGKLDPTDLQWFIPRKKLEPLALLDTLIKRKGADADMWEPLSPPFQALKKKLIVYNEIAEKGGWPEMSMPDKKTIRPGASDSLLVVIKHRLALTGDWNKDDTTSLYDSSFVTAIKAAQRSYGIKDNGIIDKSLVKELNVPIRSRIEQMLINLERMRWLPEKLAPNRIVVNIPEFALHVYEDGNKVMDMNIVVGKEGTGTVIFNDELKYIVFSPYWNVPRSIVRNEIAPAMSRDPNYLSRHNMESTGMSGGLPVVRQKPGPKNSLGRVKFLFPNNYNIYLHDTPAKYLFERDKRAFSHGCIRLADAEKMANYLLRNDPDWNPDKIKEAMAATKEKWVTLKQPLPVFISYFTSWVDEDGLLNFRDDIYGHDAKMAAKLFVGRTAEKD